MTRCPWNIRWTFGQDTQCDKEEHVTNVSVRAIPDHPGRFGVEYQGEPQHSSRLPNGVTVLTWEAGDRREFLGDWPGLCLLGKGCTLHRGHHGRCAP
jgi:hypothetical protein